MQSFFLFDAQGTVVERFLDANADNAEYEYKKKCSPGYCKDCPQGSYCRSCTNCRVATYDYSNSLSPLKMLECDCKKHRYDRDPRLTFVEISKSACTQDIANCNGTLVCGTCFGTNFYTRAGELEY